MPALFSALEGIYTSAAKIAAALGMTRQAYSQAAKRRRLSDRAAIRAAALLNIDPGQALLTNATDQDTPAPISNPTTHARGQILDEKKRAQSPPNNCQATNYAQLQHRLFLPKSRAPALLPIVPVTSNDSSCHKKLNLPVKSETQLPCLG